jgi:hypothetical protein
MDAERDQTTLFEGGRSGPGGERPGRFIGSDPTATERMAGEAVEARDEGALASGSLGHRVLLVGFGDGQPRTAYQASVAVCGNPHDRRREATRLMGRGYLRKVGQRPNLYAPGGKLVDVYVLTNNGRAALDRLGWQIDY